MSMGPPGDGLKVDLTITCGDGVFSDLAKGKLSPTAAFMAGKLKTKGSMGLAMKLGPVLAAAAEPRPKL